MKKYTILYSLGNFNCQMMAHATNDAGAIEVAKKEIYKIYGTDVGGMFKIEITNTKQS